MADTELISGDMALAALAAGPQPVRAVPEVPGMARIEEHSAWPVLSRLTVTLTAGIPLYRFKVRDLLRLETGQVIESVWPDTEDVPVNVGQVQLGWSEFEVVEQELAVRLTRLA
jgi:flagellar motor switch/type III secretory pathway protein FliN